jgi:hypothetical protein
MIESILLFLLSKVINSSWINTLTMGYQRNRLAHMLINHPEIESAEVKENGDLKFSKRKRIELDVLAQSQVIQQMVPKHVSKRKNGPKREK